jgi:hypothetical protein
MHSLVYKSFLIMKPYCPFGLLITIKTIKKSVKTSVMMAIVMIQ